METTIDRASYRRSNIKSEVQTKSKSKFSKIFYNEVIASMSILIAILIIKFFDLNMASNWIKYQIDNGVSFKSLVSTTMQKVDELRNALTFDNVSGDSNISGEVSNLEVQVGENVFQIDSENSGEQQVYETAVEGINQLSEDAKCIKENYNVKAPIKGTITSKFGCRVDDNPIVSAYHTGLDIAANTGTVISAALDGKVIESGTISGYGKCVMVQKDNLVIVYAHCSKLSVKKGQEIKQGEKIGEVGMTGNATGPHLHFEVRYDGRYVNPEDIL
jgi:murein DD-endopeptidase MepM/ murein hydrolase activator NlpD